MKTGLGVELGELCMKHGYSVREVAEVLKVAKPTVYNWYNGAKPSKKITPKIQKIVDMLRAKDAANLTNT